SPLFLNHPTTTHIYTLSLHDALPISENQVGGHHPTGHFAFLVLLDDSRSGGFLFRLDHGIGGKLERLHTQGQRLTQRSQTAQNRDRKSTPELQSQSNLVCRLLLEKKKSSGIIQYSLNSFFGFMDSGVIDVMYVSRRLTICLLVTVADSHPQTGPETGDLTSCPLVL